MKMRRPLNDRKIAGVCAAIADAVEISPRNIRIAFVLLVVFGGLSILTYLVAWAVIPSEGE